MRNCIIWILFAYIVIFGLPLFAQESVPKVYLPKLGAEITIQAPHFVGVGEQFKVKFTCSKELTNVEIEPSNDLKLLAGPSKSSTTSIRVVNDTTQKETKFDYTCIYESKQIGTFRIPSLFLKNTEESTDTLLLHIKVENRPTSSKDTVFVKAVLDKEQIQLGDSITLSLKIYTTTSELNLDPYYFDFPYCYIEEKGTVEDNSQWEVEPYEEISYYTHTFRKFLLTPLQHGNIEIPKVEFNFMLQTTSNVNPFDAFFGTPRYKKETVYTAPITIKVTP